MSRPFWLYIIVFIVCQLAGGAVAIAANLLGSGGTTGALVMSLVTANVLSVAAFLMLRPRELTWQSFADGWRQPLLRHTLAFVAAAPAVIVAVNIVQEVFLSWLPDWVGEHDFRAIMHNPLGLFTVCVLGPVAEELLFRGGVQGALQQRLGAASPWAVVWASAIFALVHANPAQMPAALLLGLLLGAAYRHTRSLAAPMAMHIVNNSLAALLALLAPPQTTLTAALGGTTTALLVAAGCLICTFLCLRDKFSLYNKV